MIETRDDDHVHLTLTHPRTWPAVAQGPAWGPGFSAFSDDVPRLVHPQVRQSRMLPVPFDEDRIVLQVPELLELVSVLRRDSSGDLDHRVQYELGMLGDLVGVVDAGEPLDLAGQGLLV